MATTAKKKTAARPRMKKASTAEIRAWALKKRYDVGDRGPLSEAVIAAYGKAMAKAR